ncbi:MAG TPA: FUSC family protein, partial [Chitinophagaceae bacterium]|nr:FUSC family protein [Chitinophagaceae bacterium]
WDSMSDWIRSLTFTLSPHTSKDHSVDEPDEKELTFREDLSNSIDILSRKQAIAHSRLNRLSLQLVDIRRIISNANPTVASLRDAIDTLKEHPKFPGKLIKYILENLTQSTHRIALCITTNRRGDIYAAKLSVERLKNNTEVLKKALPKIISDISEYQLIKDLEELIDYLEEALQILDDMSSKSVNMSFFMRNFLTGTAIPQRLPIIRFQFHPRSFTLRFSLRLALAMTIGVGIYTYFQIPKGYWMAMTTMIILQPEFGATITKAIRRLKGTISGAIIGALIFLLPLPLPVSLAIVILAAFFMAYYMQQNYALAAFFITIMVIALYQLIVPVTWELGLIRVFNTLGGAGLALLGGFAFFPLWEKYLFPTLLVKAIHANRTYFEALLEIHPLSENETERDFTTVRREAEVKNSNAFQSLKRMKEEPGGKRRVNKQDYFVITGYNIRITRLLKTINKQLEQQKVSIYFNTVSDYQELIIDILETTAGMVEKGTLYPTKDLPSSDELIRRIKVLLSEYPAQEEHTEQIARKVLLERLSREIVGLYYAVKRIIPPPRA